MQVIEYRNKHGALFKPGEKPYWLDDKQKHTSGGLLLANLVFCPETDGLRWIEHCERCELFRGHKRYQGVKCESTKPYNPPACFRGG